MWRGWLQHVKLAGRTALPRDSQASFIRLEKKVDKATLNREDFESIYKALTADDKLLNKEAPFGRYSVSDPP